MPCFLSALFFLFFPSCTQDYVFPPPPTTPDPSYAQSLHRKTQNKKKTQKHAIMRPRAPSSSLTHTYAPKHPYFPCRQFTSDVCFIFIWGSSTSSASSSADASGSGAPYTVLYKQKQRPFSALAILPLARSSLSLRFDLPVLFACTRYTKNNREGVPATWRHVWRQIGQ